MHFGCGICDTLEVARTSQGIAILLENNVTLSAVKTIELLLQHSAPAHVACLLCKLEAQRQRQLRGSS